MKIKLDKTLMFVLLLGVLILASLGFTLKESFESKITAEEEISMSKKVVLTTLSEILHPGHEVLYLEVFPNLKYLPEKKTYTLKNRK